MYKSLKDWTKDTASLGCSLSFEKHPIFLLKDWLLLICLESVRVQPEMCALTDTCIYVKVLLMNH